MIFKANSATQLPSSPEPKSTTTVDFRQAERELNLTNQMLTSTGLKLASQLLTSTEVDNDFSNPTMNSVMAKSANHLLTSLFIVIPR